ncbi:MAG: hypothetical protein JWQ79_3349 [Mucilaginibacter sp.]|nr:hypothetical protein [Mucilaginibacter sp.]
MTVNERLYVAGLLDQFEEALSNMDVQQVISILKKVELGDKNIDAILANHGLKR